MSQKLLQALDSDDLEPLMDKIRARYVHQWANCSDPTKREALWYAHTIVGDLEQELRAMAQEDPIEQ